MVTEEDFKKAYKLLRDNGIHPKRDPFVFTVKQIERFKMQGENVTDKTINGYPYVISKEW